LSLTSRVEGQLCRLLRVETSVDFTISSGQTDAEGRRTECREGKTKVGIRANTVVVRMAHPRLPLHSHIEPRMLRMQGHVSNCNFGLKAPYKRRKKKSAQNRLGIHQESSGARSGEKGEGQRRSEQVQPQDLKWHPRPCKAP
jgi:hypothetical protein